MGVAVAAAVDVADAGAVVIEAGVNEQNTVRCDSEASYER